MVQGMRSGPAAPIPHFRFEICVGISQTSAIAGKRLALVGTGLASAAWQRDAQATRGNLIHVRFSLRAGFYQPHRCTGPGTESQVRRGHGERHLSPTATFLYSPANHLFVSEQYHFENLRSEGPPAMLV